MADPRRELLNARPIRGPVLIRTYAVGVLGLAALAALWIVCVELFGDGGNPTVGDVAGYPPLVLTLASARR